MCTSQHWEVALDKWQLRAGQTDTTWHLKDASQKMWFLKHCTAMIMPYLGRNGTTTSLVVMPGREDDFEDDISTSSRTHDRNVQISHRDICWLKFCLQWVVQNFCQMLACLSIILHVDFEVCTKNLPMRVSDTYANKFWISVHVSYIFTFLCICTKQKVSFANIPLRYIGL